MNQHGPIIQSDYDQCLRIDSRCLWKFDFHQDAANC